MAKKTLQEVRVHFLGAAGTVTGSKYVVETPDGTFMVDCGMFQGLKELRLLNWEPLNFDASKIDIILLTHGHLDHVGYLPKLVQQGFKGSIIATEPTLEIARIVLLDSAKIHEEEAKKANADGYSKHRPAKPLYSVLDVEKTLRFFKSVPPEVPVRLGEDLWATFNTVGHILGAAFISVDVYSKRFVFSGDVGRPDDLLLFEPKKPTRADYLFLESTYGNRLHATLDSAQELVDIINQTIHDGGTLIIPSFAIERAQLLMYLLWDLYQKRRIPNIPIFVDSPMSNKVLAVFKKHVDWLKISSKDFSSISRRMNIITSYKETWETIDNPRPKIVIAASGMLSGGRVLTYIKQLADQENTHILLVGFQAQGTRGRQLLEGAHELKIYGEYCPIKAKIHVIDSLSAHADQSELLDWISDLEAPPDQTFLIHGEPSAQEALRVKLETDLAYNVQIPKLNQVVTLLA